MTIDWPNQSLILMLVEWKANILEFSRSYYQNDQHLISRCYIRQYNTASKIEIEFAFISAMCPYSCTEITRCSGRVSRRTLDVRCPIIIF